MVTLGASSLSLGTHKVFLALNLKCLLLNSNVARLGFNLGLSDSIWKANFFCLPGKGRAGLRLDQTTGEKVFVVYKKKCTGLTYELD